MTRRSSVANVFAHLDHPPAHVRVTWEGAGAGFSYSIECGRCGNSESTFSPTNASAIIGEHARCKERPAQ